MKLIYIGDNTIHQSKEVLSVEDYNLSDSGGIWITTEAGELLTNPEKLVLV